MEDESRLEVPVVSCEVVPVLEESPDELSPDEVLPMLPLPPILDAENAVALSMHAAHAKGIIHFFSVTITAPLR